MLNMVSNLLTSVCLLRKRCRDTTKSVGPKYQQMKPNCAAAILNLVTTMACRKIITYFCDKNFLCGIIIPHIA